MKRIESRNNPIIKYANTLRAKRTREQEGVFYFEGVHLLEEYLRAGNTPRAVLLREDVFSRYAYLVDGLGCDIYEVTDSVYEKLTDEKAPQGIFTISGYLKNVCELSGRVDEIKSNCIMLSDLQDTGNIGTVIRTASALDCAVLLCGNCADVYSAKTVRATMGALFTGNIYISPSTVTAVELLQAKGKRVIATALTDKAEVLGKFKINSGDCFVVGNEGKGLSQEVINKCDLTAIIPMTDKTESLNAAMASAILLWEAKRGQ